MNSILIITAVIVIISGIAATALFHKRKTLLAATDNQVLANELAVYEVLTNTYARGSMLKQQRSYIEQLQALDLKKRTEKSALNLHNYKMVKSFEAFNKCVELIRNNPLLADTLRQASEEEGVVILRNTIGLDDVQFKECLPMLKQTMAMVKNNLLPKSA